MHKAITALSLIALVLSIGSVSALAAQYGEKITVEKATSIEELLANPAPFEGKVVRVEGTIQKSCANSGCWIYIGDEKNSIYAKSFDHSVLVPTDVVGKRAIVQGKVQLVGDEKGEAKHQCAHKKGEESVESKHACAHEKGESGETARKCIDPKKVILSTIGIQVLDE
jgi:hypothetical protein